MRRVKIVATVGPACSDTKILAALLREGADVLRINASHTTPEGLREWIHKIREAAEIVQKNISILVDLQGPRVRTGRIKKGRIVLKPKTQINIRIGPDIGSNSEIVTPCREFSRMIRAGDRVLLDNGVMELEAQFVEPECVQCRVITGGVLGENKGINLPNAPVTLPALTTKDLADLKIAEELNVDYVALSFVRSEEDVLTIKQWLEKAGKNIPVIAKIEKPRAVNRIQQILEHTDAVMIARGDLGIEMGVEKIPAIQKRLIKFANDRKVPIITATQMLESMMHCPRPTRAEASDVANAVFDGTDAVMLSGETAIGKYPVEAVRTMSRIILEAESHVKESPENGQQATKGSELDAIVRAAKDAAHYLKAEAIVVFTVSGKTAVHISKLGSDLPIIVLTPSKEVQARLAL
ncbi:MAG: pyruvate kinase, partial [Candidatus Omnitrophica bacterium CG11_big_fil_rev_8_21_14_0_20_45_26]